MNGNNLDGQSVGELVSTLFRGFSRILSQEIELAKAEMSQKASLAIKGGVLLAAGGAAAFAGFLAIVAACVGAVWTVLPLWLAALLVGVFFIVIGLCLAIVGIYVFKRGDFRPRATIETLKEDVQWMKTVV
ncbi:MAG TPA: phage holin family protein [Thermodesulfobacteriota bacterium]|nr:phage holin family protein [Thermodesulfobacteriota bacterium]